MRLLTRSDFDGLACAVLLTDAGVVDDYLFIHPREIQQGGVDVTINDALANVPFAEGCGLWFDHHSSEEQRLTGKDLKFDGLSRNSPSAAQLIWEYYGGISAFGQFFNPLIKAVNKIDSADLRLDEVLSPTGWVLLSFIIDPRTGLDRYRFSEERKEFFLRLIDQARFKQIQELMELPSVAERVEMYHQEQSRHKDMLRRRVKIIKNLIVVNLLNEKMIFAGNRFLALARHPDQNVELRISWDETKSNVIFNCGCSIFNKSCVIDIGKLMLKYGGGGHRRVGSCVAPVNSWKKVYKELIKGLTKPL